MKYKSFSILFLAVSLSLGHITFSNSDNTSQSPATTWWMQNIPEAAIMNEMSAVQSDIYELSYSEHRFADLENTFLESKQLLNKNREELEAYIEKIFGHLNYTLRTTQGSYPFVTNKESKVVKAMETSIKEVLGITTKHSTAGGTSDARYFGAFGIEAIEFGVINDTIHSVGERTTVKEVEGLTAVFEDLIRKF